MRHKQSILRPGDANIGQPTFFIHLCRVVYHNGNRKTLETAQLLAGMADLPIQLFRMLDALPLASITSFIGIILVIVFFVTSSDSGSLVIDTITAGGKVDAPVPQRVFWCVFEGAVAIVLLLSAGGLASLQSMVISTGLPFTIVLLVMCWAIFRGLQSERAKM